ncbi:YciI family protein [Geochorda subterranea]|uniref:YciI family protein n=1 Tax=Geochorda subterranea TaxID=3109564 RepID=A0ABZ1BRT7_9FIRM|nr:YciI family protein [Limnochorda sp. LNt]WRP15288.1 YciI family protein [Limnochorda sp. LNt]
MEHVVALLWIVDPEANRRLRPAHLEYIGRLHREGKVVMAGPFGDGSGGMVVYRVDSVDEARRLVLDDPVVSGGARRFSLLPWTPLELSQL